MPRVTCHTRIVDATQSAALWSRNLCPQINTSLDCRRHLNTFLCHHRLTCRRLYGHRLSQVEHTIAPERDLLRLPRVRHLAAQILRHRTLGRHPQNLPSARCAKDELRPLTASIQDSGTIAHQSPLSLIRALIRM